MSKVGQCPLYPRKRTLDRSRRMSAKGHERTSRSRCSEAVDRQPNQSPAMFSTPIPVILPPASKPNKRLAASLKVALVDDPQAVERIGKKWERRKARKPVPTGRTYSGPIRFELGSEFMKRIARSGGRARASLPNLSDINRRAALTRWRRARQPNGARRHTQ